MPLTKYVDKLPIPIILKPKQRGRLATNYEVRMKQVKQKLHRDLKPTTVWGYEGTYPGPTFEVRKGELVKVKWINQLPNKHLLPVDKSITGPVPAVRTVVHLHGGRSPANSDGHPQAWFTKGFAKTGPRFVSRISTYPNRQNATTLWYHDHTLAITRLNVYAGLAGFYLIRDKNENCLNLPKGKYEIPLVVQDRSFNPNGSLFYPKKPDTPKKGIPIPSVVPEFFGDTILVNGKVWPYLEVEPRKYRFRILNGSNSRFYTMRLSSGQPFYQIGTDQGLLAKPVLVKQILLAPAERADVIIDFSKQKGKKIILTNNARSPFPVGDPVNPNTTGQIMQFKVKSGIFGKDTSSIPKFLTRLPKLKRASAVKVRNMTLVESTDRFNRLLQLIDGKRFEAPVNIKPRLNTVEVWNLINLTEDTHPIHPHLVKFQILSRQPFDVNFYIKTRKLKFTGPAVLPQPNERGWKDTVRANPGQVTRIIARYGPFNGQYVVHCHILEHEDHDMMRPYTVVRGKK